MDRSVLPALWETPAAASGLVDQHSYPLTHRETGLGTVERQLALALTGSAEGAAGQGSFLDSRLGLAVRRWCPPLLGLPPHVSAARYLARRRQLGTYTATRMLLRGSGIRHLLVAPHAAPFAPLPAAAWHLADSTAAPGSDGGGAGLGGPLSAAGADADRAEVEPQTSVPELAGALHTGTAREVTGLEELVRQIADTSGSLRSFLRNVDDGVWGAAAGSVAFVIGVWPGPGAPPGTGSGGLRPADPVALRQATSRWLAARRPGTRAPSPALPPELLLHLVRVAGDTGRPVQLRCADPAPLLPLLRACAGRGPLVLLPDAPKHRDAARLAAVFPRVYCDVGPDPRETVPEAPFSRLMFASRAWLLPELHVLRARQFHYSLGRLLDEWVADGVCRESEARHIAARVGASTARRLYGLDTAAGD